MVFKIKFVSMIYQIGHNIDNACNSIMLYNEIKKMLYNKLDVQCRFGCCDQFNQFVCSEGSNSFDGAPSVKIVKLYST